MLHKLLSASRSSQLGFVTLFELAFTIIIRFIPFARRVEIAEMVNLKVPAIRVYIEWLFLARILALHPRAYALDQAVASFKIEAKFWWQVITIVNEIKALVCCVIKVAL